MGSEFAKHLCTKYDAALKDVLVRTQAANLLQPCQQKNIMKNQALTEAWEHGCVARQHDVSARFLVDTSVELHVWNTLASVPMKL